MSMVSFLASAMGELLPLPSLREQDGKEPALELADLSGRLVELSSAGAGADLSFAFTLVGEAQAKGEPVGWVSSRQDSFFPPDAAAAGIDLASLVVVRLTTPAEALRAADKLTRSGAFGLLVLDLGRDPVGPAPLLSRLLSLALKHATALVALTEKDPEAPSLSSLVSLRALVGHRRLSPGRFEAKALVVKDKRHAPGWTQLEIFRGPAGLY